MSRKTSKSKKSGSSAGNQAGSGGSHAGLAVPGSVEVQGVGAAGESVAKELNAGRNVDGSFQARVVIADLESAAEAARVAGVGADGVRTWIALLTDGSGAESVGVDLDQFEQVLDELEPGKVDLVLLVDPSQAGELIAAWTVVKAEAPASVLSRLPDSDGSACHYVALTGVAVVGADEGAGASAGGSDGSGATAGEAAALRGSMREFVREAADEVRSAREQVAAAVAGGSASSALSANGQLDAALDQLKERTIEGLDGQVSDFVAAGAFAGEPGDNVVASDDTSASDNATPSGDANASNNETVSNNSTASREVDLDALTKARTAALSEFVLVGSKGGLGKLLSKSRLKLAGEQFLKATDSYVEGQGSVLIDELTEIAEPRVREAQQAQVQQQALARSADLLNQAAQAAAKLDPASVGDATKINRSWTTGTPAPRRYLLASNLTVAALDPHADPDLDLEFFTVPVDGLACAYVLQAQYALSRASVGAY